MLHSVGDDDVDVSCQCCETLVPLYCISTDKLYHCIYTDSVLVPLLRH